MRNMIAFILSVTLITGMCACNAKQDDSISEEMPVMEVEQEVTVPEEVPQESTPEVTQPKVIEYLDAEEIDFAELLLQVSDTHKEINTSTTCFDGFTDYLVNDPSAKGLLTLQEIQAIQAQNPAVDLLTYEQAVADIDLYFRTLKYGYGAYYYFGGDEVFNAAKEYALSKIAGEEKVTGNLLEAVIRESVSFVRDGHFDVGDLTADTKKRYEYFYCENQEFSKDDKGFYKLSVDGTKWYFESCDNEEVTIAPSLNKEGKLVYSPMLFTKTPCLKSMIILHSGEETVEEEILWIENQAYDGNYLNDADYRFIKESGIAYISIRGFSDLWESDMKQFVQDARKVRDADVIIFDIRANGGGDSSWSNRWTANFKGEPQLNTAFSYRTTALTDGPDYRKPGHEKYEYNISRGTFVKNDIPVILLLDDECGSSGESMLLRMMANENVMVVGTNSAGCALCGNRMEFSLPNSGIHIGFGASLSFNNTMENIDSKGFMPDVWCNPKDALDYAIRLIGNYGLASSESLALFEADLEKQKPAEIKLCWENPGGIIIEPGEGFGGLGGEQTLAVLLDGEPCTLLDIVNENYEVCTIKVINGKIQLTPKSVGICRFSVIVGNHRARFRWHS